MDPEHQRNQVIRLGFDLFPSGLEGFVVGFDDGTGSVPPPPLCRRARSRLCVC